MFAYCNNNPCNQADGGGCCSYFLFIKNDCYKVFCPDSVCYDPDASTIVVIYDGRDSGSLIRFVDRGDNGFQHQGQELIKRLSLYYKVEGYAYTTMDDFVNIWNSLDGSYDDIYILGHGQPGKFNAIGGSLRDSGSEYSYSNLNSVNVKDIYLYICNGDTWPEEGTSTAYSFANLTGASVHAVRDGKLSFTWYGCYPYMPREYRGVWTITSPS